MLLGDLLIAHGALTAEDVKRALERQKMSGGLFGENVMALGLLTEAQLQEVIESYPPMPKSIQDTGLSLNFLLTMTLKILYVYDVETPSQMTEILKVSSTIGDELLETAKERKLVEVLGASGLSLASELRYSLTTTGREWASEALEQSQYSGAAPVPLDIYCAQIERQAINTERVQSDTLAKELGELILPNGFLDDLGPAVNSGRAMLLYGPPGTGKTSIAEAIGRAFKGLVYVPYAVEIDGQIMKVFDPTLHQVVTPEATNGSEAQETLKRMGEDIDPRWSPCRRPIMVAGGELSLELLDLSFNPHSKFYEAPLQVKALNGVFLIDDLGRQKLEPKDLLNRWIIPLDRRVDYLALHTGKKFKIPFNELVIFSTNLEPEDLMDDAFLRRIAYKIEMKLPTDEEYGRIFKMVCEHSNVDIPEGFVDEIIEAFYRSNDFPFGSHHPKFIMERAIDKCRYTGELPYLNKEMVGFALKNLYIRAKGASVTQAKGLQGNGVTNGPANGSANGVS
jgi:hypothetical protein